MKLYSELTDAELIALLKQADHTAFEEIYNRYSPKIFYQVNQMLRDQEAAKDLVQELFITIWSKAHNIKTETSLGGYLYIAAQNSVFKRIQRGKLQNDYIKSLARFGSTVSQNTTDAINEKELHELIDKEISKLPAKMKQVFELSRKENLSYQEIALQLEISEHTVRNQISNSLKILREKLGPHISTGMIVIALLRRS